MRELRPSPPRVPARGAATRGPAADGGDRCGVLSLESGQGWAVVSPVGVAATATSSVSSVQNYVISEVRANAAWKMDGTKSLMHKSVSSVCVMR